MSVKSLVLLLCIILLCHFSRTTFLKKLHVLLLLICTVSRYRFVHFWVSSLGLATLLYIELVKLMQACNIIFFYIRNVFKQRTI